MKSGFGKRALALVLTLVLCLSLLPVAALAGYSQAEAFYYDLVGSGDYNYDSYLEQDSDGNIKFSLSGGVPEGYTITSVYLVTSETHNRVGAIFLNGNVPQGATGGYESSSNETFYNAVWIENVTLSGVEVGLYQTEFVTGSGSFFTEDFSDEWHSAVGAIEVVENGSTGSAIPSIATTTLDQGYVDEPYSFTMSGSAAVTSWSASGLPDGLTMSDTGVISGTPAQEGSYIVAVTASDGSTQVQKNITLTVNTARMLKVTFDLNGGSGTAAAAQGPYGTVIELPAAPYKAGSAFAGWYDGGVKAGDAGGQYTIKKNVTLCAQWAEQAGVTVAMPDGLGQVAGSLWLSGTYSTGGGTTRQTLWSKNFRRPATASDITLKAGALGDVTYTALELYAYVDGTVAVIARYDGDVAAGAIGGTNAEVTLTTQGCQTFTLLSDVEVAGLTKGVDYIVYQIRDNSGAYIGSYSLPTLVTTGRTYSVTLAGMQNSPAYAVYKWDTQTNLSIGADHILSLAEPAKLEAGVMVSGTVKWDQDGAPAASYVTVQATQEVGGIYRTTAAYTNRSGEFTMELYPDAAATFTVLDAGGALYMTSGDTLAANGTGIDLTVKHITLTADVTYKLGTDEPTEAQTAAVERYLAAMGWMSQTFLTVTGGAMKDYYSISQGDLKKSIYTNSLCNTASAGSVTCTLSGTIFDTISKTAVISEGAGTVSFAPTLRPGVVANLRASQTMGVIFVYFDADGKYLSESSSFSIDAYDGDYAALCPAGTKTVALLPGAFAGTLPTSATVSSLTGDQKLTAWTLDAPIAGGQIEALSDYAVSKETTENSVYVTKPYSTLSASADSFLTDNDVISFTGSIGLDSGLDGKLYTLYVNPRSSQAGGYTSTANIQSLVIDGQAYAPENAMTGGGTYRFDLSEGIELPCDYTIYCTPGNMAYDMSLTVTADVARNNDQLIGSAVVSRPGASLETLSTYVCEDTITVAGTARQGEKVTIYDSGAVIGTARGNGSWGEWSARVPLYGTDDSQTTVHQLYTVTDSGVVSQERLVIHNSAGPQLTKFTMTWARYGGSYTQTINMGDSYTFTGAMYDTTFKATFTNPDKLLTKTAWNSKVVFKVYTTDGQIRFLEAADQGGGVFAATAPTALRSSVTAAEVLYEPNVPGPMTKGEGTNPDTCQAPAEYAGAAESVARTVKAEMTTKLDPNENATYLDAYSSNSVVVQYGNDGKPANLIYRNYELDKEANPNNPEGTTVAITNQTDDLAKLVQTYYDAGLKVISTGTMANSELALQDWLGSIVWDVSALNHIATDDKKNTHERLYSLSKLYTGGTNKGQQISAQEAFEIEKNFIASAKNVTHTQMKLENNDSYDMYQITVGENGSVDCRVTVTFLACDGVYTMAATATFSPLFCNKAIAEKWDAIKADVARQKAAATAGLPVVTASANGYVSVSNRLLASAPSSMLVMATDIDQMQPIDDDRNSYLFRNPDGSYNEEDHTYYMRGIASQQGVHYVDDMDQWDILEMQRLQNYNEGRDGKWADPKYYNFSGDFRPTSSIGQTCMSDVNAYYERQRDPATSTFSSGVEEWSGHINFGAAGAGLFDKSGVSSAVGDVSAATSIASNLLNTADAHRDLDMMRKDLEQLRNSPCYKKLDEGQRELVDTAYKEFDYWYDSASNQLNGVAAINAVCNVGGCAAGRAKGKFGNFKATDLRNGLAGLVLSTSGEFNGMVGGQMIKTSFTNAIVTYNDGYKKIKGILRSRSNQLEDPDCAGKPTSMEGPKDDGEKKKNKTGNDPSGVVYEGVIQNPVEGAVVTLYYGANNVGGMVTQENAGTVSQLKPASDVRTLIPRQETQTTGPDGKYQWGVPAGLWYVTAQYAGMEGDSGADAAATVPVSGVTLHGHIVDKLLPVLPVQLDVNIPLVDDSAPTVEAVQFTTEGVYVTFSKYMADTDGGASVLTADNYVLSDAAGPVTGFTVESAEQGNAPANVDPNMTTYSRTVLLKPASGSAFEGELFLEVAGTVESYAGTPMGAAYGETGQVGEMTALAAPAFDPASGAEVLRGNTVTISLPAGVPDGTKILYTTDGSAPSAESKVYDGPVAITDDMTIQAMAVCTGWKDSPAVSASYTITKTKTPAPDDNGNNNNNNGGTTGGGGAAAAAPSVNVGGSNGRYDHGTVKASAANANAGDKVTLTVTPDPGYQLDKLTVTDAKGNVIPATKNADGTYSFIMPETTVTVEPVFVKAANTGRFVDVPSDAYYSDAVDWAVEKGISNGTDDTHFSPNAPCTRAQMVTFLWRAAGSPVPGGTASQFTDVVKGSYYEKAVAWAVENGVTKGTSETTFSPDDTVTRGQCVTFLFRALDGKAQGDNPFTDVTEGAYYYDAILWAVANGITNGKTPTAFGPGDDCTRAQIVTFLYRAMGDA